jgi:tetratricopeptide (TPR) repeat protein
MTGPAAKRLQEQDTSRHFLLSKTDTRALEDPSGVQPPELVDALKARFPDVRTETAFIEAAVEKMTPAKKFAAMAVRCDQPEADSDRSPDGWTAQDWTTIAEIVTDWSRQQRGLWGLIRPDTFAVCCPDQSARELLRRGRQFQQTVCQRLDQTVTIGISEFPCIAYAPAEALENTLKALDHAAFFGPNSAVVFDAVSLNISGDHFYDRGDFETAIAEFKRALSLDATNVNVHNSLGVCFGILGEHDRAKASFRKALELDPEEHMAVYNLGQVYLLGGERAAALKRFVEANDLRGGVFEIVFQTGKLYLETGEPEKGRPYLEEARQLDPGSGQVCRYLGECHSALGNTSEAIDAYQQAVRANPNDATSLSALGCLLDAHGENPEIAMVFCRESVSLAPENARFRHRLGTLYLKHNRLDRALREFRKAELLGYDSAEDIQTVQARKAALR